MTMNEFRPMFIEFGVSLGFAEDTMLGKCGLYYQGLSLCDMKILSDTFFKIFEGYNDEYKKFPTLKDIRIVYSTLKPKLKPVEDHSNNDCCSLSEFVERLVSDKNRNESDQILYDKLKNNGFIDEAGKIVPGCIIDLKPRGIEKKRQLSLTGYEYTSEEIDEGIQCEF